MATKRKIVAVAFADGKITFGVYGLPDEHGAQTIGHSLTIDLAEIHTDLVDAMIAEGVKSAYSNRYQRVETPAEVVKAGNEFLAALRDGSYKPGRSAGEPEYDDLVLAVAEATSKTPDAIQTEFDTRSARDNTGAIITTTRGGKTSPRKFFDAAMRNKLAHDKRIAPILARLAEERAKALKAEARDKDAPDMLGGMFGDTEQAAAAE